MSNQQIDIDRHLSGWRNILLSDLCVLIKDGTHGTHSRFDAGIPLLSAKNIGESGQIFFNESESCISEKDYRQIHASWKPILNDVLLTIVGTIGRRAIVATKRKFTFQRSVAVLRSDINKILPHFLYHYFGQQSFQNQLQAKSNATAQAGVYLGEISSVQIFTPPIDEQREIVQVLSTVDSLLEKSHSLIAKYLAIKQGMMQDLFTRGVDENGQLRPSQKHVPELYKETIIGIMPRPWVPKRLNDLVSPNRPIVYGILMPGYGYPGGVPVIKVKDIKDGIVDESDLLLTSPEIDHQYRRSKVQEGDLLFTIRGTVGRTAIVPNSLDGANITQDTARLSITEGDARFVKSYFEMPIPASFIRNNTLGVAVQGINLRDVRKIPIASPTVSEQKAIGDIIDGIESIITTERNSLAKLSNIKLGLMHDLLTGKVRVKVDEPTESAQDVGVHQS
jgi:type I restriction enzyme S subunit